MTFKKLLEVINLRTYFYTKRGVVKANEGVSLSIEKGEIMGLVGESGSGKSVFGLSIIRLIRPPGKIVSGKIMFKDEDLLVKSEEEMRDIRRKEIAMIFQDPHSAFNPLMRIGEQIKEAIRRDTSKFKNQVFSSRFHKRDSDDFNEIVLNSLRQVGIPEPKRMMRGYPHQFSGGMKQRAMIAMALVRKPSLIIADEPTTALDVTIQDQIINLLKEVRDETMASILFITHDLALASEICDKVTVIYAGEIVETAPSEVLFSEPQHPYTKALLNSIPQLHEDKEWLTPIEGRVPSLINTPPWCNFYNRCKERKEMCKNGKPKSFRTDENHMVKCHLLQKEL